MQELVNTSLPNGLIAGTHGFATVAMTKGLSDVLRGRLESLCAYTHRTSVHDATYYQQNPVNWFHVILPQGEHVVGRVAPSDFDYTGRTNRLARLRIFGVAEMPSVGGAEVLLKGKPWFSQPWQGDPRYLEEDRNTAGQLRLLEPRQAYSAPAWEALFGSNGSRYARQIAWQLEKNLAAGGKSIYFKTSTAWDASGEKLLGLFSDVINFLPPAMRGRVTFSTYPVPLPGGTGCNLRGIYDRDRFFDASSSTQAWVDCENAKLVHPEMLPTEGPARKTDAKDESARPAYNATFGSSVPSTSSRLGAHRGPAAGGEDTNSYRNLLAPQKKGPDVFVIGIIAACVAAVIGAGGFFFWMMQSNKKQMQDSGAAAAVEQAGIKSFESNPEEKARLAKEKEVEAEQRKEERDRTEEERTKKEKEDIARKENELNQKDAHAKARDAADYAEAKAEKVAKKKQSVAYLDAEDFRRGSPSYKYNSVTKQSTEPFVESDGCRVYYYVNGVVTNEPAGFKVPNKNIPSNAMLRWGNDLCKKLEEIPLVKYGFVIWYNPKEKRVYFDLQRRAKLPEDGEKWFEEKKEVNLSEKYFGGDENFEALWAKYTKYRGGRSTCYLVGWTVSEKYKSVKPIIFEKATVTAEEMIEEMQQHAVKEFEVKIASAKQKVHQLQKEKDNLQGELDELNNETNSLKRAFHAYKKLSTEISTLSDEIKNLKKKKPKNWESDKEKKEKEKEKKEKKQKQILYEGSENPTGKVIKGPGAFKTINDLDQKITEKTSNIETKTDEIDKKNQAINKAKDVLKETENSKKESLDKFKKNIRRVRFTVGVGGEKVEE